MPGFDQETMNNNTKLIKLKSLKLQDFGPFVGAHTINFPESGLCLVKGKVAESGDGSGAGKSFLLKAVSHLFGGCLDPGTELQSWFSEDPPEANSVIEVSGTDINVKRRKGLSVSGSSYKEAIKGKSAEPELDKIFGMDEKSRALVTYRGQGQPGLFLSLSDEKKKSFLGTLLGLEHYERVAKAAQEKAAELEGQVSKQKGQIDYEYDRLVRARKDLELAEVDLQNLPKVDNFVISDLRAKIELLRLDLQEEQKVISDTKAKYAAELEAVLGTIRAKSKLVYQRQEPIEVAALKTELEKQRARLDKCKAHDAAAKLTTEKLRNEFVVQIRDLRSTVGNKRRLELELQQANSKIEVLLAQKCSECKRAWDGDEHKKSLEGYQNKAASCKAELEAVALAEQTLLAVTTQLNAVKDPEPHPAGEMTIAKIAEVDLKIKGIKVAFEEARRQEILVLEKQEESIKAEFRATLAKELQEKSAKSVATQAALENDLNEERRLSGTLAQLDVRNAVLAERQTVTANLEVSYKNTAEKKNQLEKAYWLEKDVAALVGKTGFLGSIIEEVLVEIASVANDILSQVANVSHLSIAFETEKEAVTTGNITAKIVPVIFSRGRRVSLSSGVSGGQRTSIHLAVDLAIGEVVSNRRGSYPGWLVLDEALDGLGAIAKESALEMLKTHCGNRLVLVVDHDASFQGLFDSVIEVEMVDGQSNIVVS